MFMEFFGHLEKNYKKRTNGFGKRRKYEQSHKLTKKLEFRKKKSERETCLLFWLEICAIIGSYFIPILVLKFQFKVSVKTSDKTKGFLSLSFFVFLLYSRVILSFSLSPSLLLCPFHCFNY